MKLKKIKLNELSDVQLNEKEMCRILGGTGNCQCGCHYTDSGGSSSSDNNSANDAGDLSSDPTEDSSDGGITHPDDFCTYWNPQDNAC